MKLCLLLSLVALLSLAVAQHHVKPVEEVVAGHGGHVAHVAEDKSHHVKKSGKKYAHEHEHSAVGHQDGATHRRVEEERGGKKHRALDEAHHEVAGHHEEKHKHAEKTKHAEKQKKGAGVKAYREQYHKDERKKSDSHYSTGHHAAEWSREGSSKSKHRSERKDKDARGKFQNSKSGDRHSKEQKSAQKQKSSDHRGHRLESGEKSHHAKHEKYSKKSSHKK